MTVEMRLCSFTGRPIAYNDRSSVQITLAELDSEGKATGNTIFYDCCGSVRRAGIIDDDSYLNPNIKIYVGPCYHKMCETCLTRIFVHGQAPCPECGILLRKVNFMYQTFEDIEVERECKIRKMLRREFYRREEDFKNEMEYNDYLEEFENVVMELMEYKNEQEISKRIEEFRSLYGEISRINSEKEKSEIIYEEEIPIILEESDEKSNKKQKIIDFQDEIVKSDKPCEQILKNVMKISTKKYRNLENEIITHFDPLEGIETLVSSLNKKCEIPTEFKVKYNGSGFSYNLIIFKSLNSLYNENI
ncbi:CDK-activating kinase assembly factor MAT1 [Hamiltosporidium magnivora]|uniref:CDK-activating kinase assembly factor MAT1 n=1 Tax=Hamiltosporidium magnivora TaxID=148818 RepID=A0A4Q9KWG1_9MICR|nr:CDK-activating kinase assembly factor MAT1 [Hamiltosporidium magnivora]